MSDTLNQNMEALLQVIGNKPSTQAILLSLSAALVFSLILWGTYRFANTALTYRPMFGITLVMLAFISTVLMDLIQSNLALSLGMLGSLSIVRFRTNIKDPRDIGFIFWSMAIGIAAATQSYFLGAAGCLVLALFMLLTMPSKNQLPSMLLVIRGSASNIRQINNLIALSSGEFTVKAKNILSDSFELVYEVHLSDEDSDSLTEKIFALGGIDSVNLLSQNTAQPIPV